MNISDVINLDKHPLSDENFQKECKATLDKDGALIMKDFIPKAIIEKIKQEGIDNQHKAYFCTQNHNVYLTEPDPEYAEDHPRNRNVVSSKGCITDDQIPLDSPLHVIYDSEEFRNFLCTVLNEEGLYDYADSLSSINLHYASEGQELGWHFDNSSFAITLMIQEPTHGGDFEYVENVRDADNGEMNFDAVKEVLDGKIPVKTLNMPAGTLVMFRGRNAIHRVAPVKGDRTRMLVVLAYNSKPGVAISESASKTFYGRVG